MTTKKLSDFPLDTKLSLIERTAALLDWAAKHMPFQSIAYNVACKTVMGYRHTPRANAEEVLTFRKKMSRVRPTLLRDYHRDLISIPGQGLRATVDSEDVVRHALPTRASRLKSSIVSVNNTVKIVEPGQLPAGAEFAAHKRFFNSMRGATNQIAAPDFLTKLLPPGKEMPTVDSFKSTGTHGAK